MYCNSCGYRWKAEVEVSVPYCHKCTPSLNDEHCEDAFSVMTGEKVMCPHMKDNRRLLRVIEDQNMQLRTMEDQLQITYEGVSQVMKFVEDTEAEAKAVAMKLREYEWKRKSLWPKMAEQSETPHSPT